MPSSCLCGWGFIIRTCGYLCEDSKWGIDELLQLEKREDPVTGRSADPVEVGYCISFQST
jgi:hypothetical protein